ncbi:2-iminoacetate synthase ThiH [Campylobacter sp. 19-13652]|uniref:2-iminoacetate synthase ThiH n=1 Tax=Campylobacter sp. 19-13652 TaxID=2840180 RepID=UPI001C770B97|nr:2-iminoacetate synthase ThiH [Campylobacter sp. 19-13652]BCX79600.1 thiamine biosynthesis protein ThiH [Campylobacter sp. 19-13652]
MKFKRTDHMSFLAGQQDVGTQMMDEVLAARDKYDPDSYSADDVVLALKKPYRSLADFGALLSPAADEFLEQIAATSKRLTRSAFGENITLFTPLYISNFCENHCVYCGFSEHNNIRRHQLSDEAIRSELEVISATGLQEILLLTGEAPNHTSVEYIANAVRLAREKFKVVGVEIYPLNVDGYAKLKEAGADFVSVYQETYSTDKYERLHLAGNKRIFPYRFAAQERAILGGMRGVSFAALLGIDNWRKDAYATGVHAYLIQQKYPHAEIGFSCPRLRPILGNAKLARLGVSERELLQAVMAYRLLMPLSSITISTRERAHFRDNVIGLVANKMSAGVSVAVGEHSEQEKQGDGQFEIDDTRSVAEVCAAIRSAGLMPLMSEYVYV